MRLVGGKMPFCLRPWGDQFLLVGECYVHGLMTGEAITTNSTVINADIDYFSNLPQVLQSTSRETLHSYLQ
jgi:hypothetical protein